MTTMKSAKHGSTAFYVTSAGVAVKQYEQHSSGSSYMKIPFHVMQIADAGHTNIELRLNGSWGAANQFSDVVKLLKVHLPHININLRLTG